MMVWLWAAMGAYAGCDEQSEAARAATSKALEGMVIQSRQQQDPSALVDRVRKLVADDGVCTPEDTLRAALVLTRGAGEGLLEAHELAKASYAARPTASAGRAAAQALDMYRTQQTQPQPYGTLRGVEKGVRCLFPVDPATTDAEREALGLPGLDGLLQEFVDKTGLAVEPTLDALQAAGHLCPLANQEAPPPEEMKSLDGIAAPDPYLVSVDGPKRVDASEVERGRRGASLGHGELYGQYRAWSGNAYTVDKGELIFRPFMRSVYGIADGVQIGSNLLGNFAPDNAFGDAFPLGANVHVELAPLQNQDGAVSVEGGFITPVITTTFFEGYHVYGEFKGTGYLSKPLSLTFAVMAMHQAVTPDDTATSLLPKLSLEVSFGSNAMAILNARADVLGSGAVPLAGGGGYVAYATGKVGFSIGLNVDAVPVTIEDLDTGVALPALPIVPSPHAQLWFRPGNRE